MSKNILNEKTNPLFMAILKAVGRGQGKKAQQIASKSNKKLGGLVKDLIDSVADLNSYDDKLEKKSPAVGRLAKKL